MRTSMLLGLSLVATLVSACASNDTSSLASVPPTRDSTVHGWISPDARKAKLLYAGAGDFDIDIFSVPKYLLVGQITDGIDVPSGIATDSNGNLYVANSYSDTVTVYPLRESTPSLTLTVPGNPNGVAVAANGYVVVGDYSGAVDVYPPGRTSPSSRLTNPNIGHVYVVAVDAENDVYAGGSDSTTNYSGTPVVVKYAKMRGSGTVVGLKNLPTRISGMLVDEHGNIVVSGCGGHSILQDICIYPPGKKSPSSKLSVEDAFGVAFDEKENLIYVAQYSYRFVRVLDYPSGSLVAIIPLANLATGVALIPAPKP
jgi:hypothetical protein